MAFVKILAVSIHVSTGNPLSIAALLIGKVSSPIRLIAFGGFIII